MSVDGQAVTPRLATLKLPAGEVPPGTRARDRDDGLELWRVVTLRLPRHGRAKITVDFSQNLRKELRGVGLHNALAAYGFEAARLWRGTIAKVDVKVNLHGLAPDQVHAWLGPQGMPLVWQRTNWEPDEFLRVVITLPRASAQPAGAPPAYEVSALMPAMRFADSVARFDGAPGTPSVAAWTQLLRELHAAAHATDEPLRQRMALACLARLYEGAQARPLDSASLAAAQAWISEDLPGFALPEAAGPEPKSVRLVRARPTLRDWLDERQQGPCAASTGAIFAADGFAEAARAHRRRWWPARAMALVAAVVILGLVHLRRRRRPTARARVMPS
jgi:hypothetical protein